jgi:hypothetical protein
MTENSIHHIHNNCNGCNCWISVSDTKNSYVIHADYKTEERMYGKNWMCIHCWNNWIIEFPYFKNLINNAMMDLWRKEHKV